MSAEETVTHPGRTSARVSWTPRKDVFERFILGEQLGAGGMGAVYLARDVVAGREVAFKRILPGIADLDEIRARFVREAQVQARLEHPSVVPVHEMGVDPEGALYFVMKRVRGHTLREVLEALRCGESELTRRHSRHSVLVALGQVALALDFAHRHGVVHRDLKPGNLMLGEFGEVYLLDWGLARLDDGGEYLTAMYGGGEIHTANQMILGTPGYAPAEQLSGRIDKIGPGVDVWALGAILFEALTGTYAVEGESASDRIEVTIRGVDASPAARSPGARIPPELDALCVRAMAPRPEDRPDAREFHRQLAVHLSGELDRELEQRLASEHRARAREAVERALVIPGEAGIAARREAWAEVGKTLALEPNHPEARAAIATLLETPPKLVPESVTTAIEEAGRDENRTVARLLALLSTAGLGATIGLLVWAGTRNWPLALALLFFNALAVVLGLRGGGRRRGRAIDLHIAGLAATHNLVLLGRAAGPVVIVPGFFAVLITMAGLIHRPRERIVHASILLTGYVIPSVLEYLRVLPPSYVFSEQGVRIVPSLSNIPEAPFYAGFFFTGVFALGGAVIAARVRVLLNTRQMERETLAWQLRQMVEPDGAVEAVRT